MLINLSNHPVKNWTESQLTEASSLFGKVVDIHFPQIDPNAKEHEIEILSEKYLQICIEKFLRSSDKNNAVHIMGEHTFVVKLVNQLLDNGIICVASTTKRVTNENNGIKTSRFNFVKFRKYNK